ncbi:hypothetical protein [Aeromonas hydrophila]|uniref:hypothetical protein n=1 Tax=Aeromonas hydrophila TaxID=644 RepID=UPI002B4782FC|nr:hypothetical protein [Aeromonas hydrophila]
MSKEVSQQAGEETVSQAVEQQVAGKHPVNPHAYVLSQAAFQLYTSAAHSKDDVAERLQLLEDYLVKVSAVEGEE